MPNSPHTSSTSAPFDFGRDVIEASHERPVLIDFWAPWCGPCQVLGPVLEKLAAEANGTWTLIKINTDAHQDLAQQAGIRGIPAVKLIIDGRVTAEFTGALPEPVLRRWLEEHLPSPAKKLLAEAESYLADGRRDAAHTTLQNLLADNPQHEDARLLLARLVVFDNAERARELVQGLQHRPEAEAIRVLADYLSRVRQAELPESPARASYTGAASRLAEGELDQALSLLIDALRQDRYYDDDGPRRVTVALFVILGEQHELTRKHRPEFNRSLY